MPHSLLNTDASLATEDPPRLSTEFGCPVWVYDAQTVRRQIAALRQLDMTHPAQRACSNIYILHLMREQGAKVDSIPLDEIERALAVGYNPQTRPDDIVFTADVIDQTMLERVSELRIPMNAGSVNMLDRLGQASPGHRIWLRVSPGFGHGHSQKTNTGGENSKHDIWHTGLPVALGVIQRHHLQLAGIHMHIGSGIDYARLEQVCGAMVRQVLELSRGLQAISAGDGLSIPCQQGEEAVGTERYYGPWNVAHEQTACHLGHPVKLEIEPSRPLITQAGVLTAQVRSIKQVGSRHFVLVDVELNDLMRPAMHGSHHHISALAADGHSLEHVPTVEIVIVRPLYELDDIFTQQEGGSVEACALPGVKACDYLILHDTGVHGASASSNYSSHPLLPEVLFDNDQARSIRRHQTIEELLVLELP